MKNTTYSALTLLTILFIWEISIKTFNIPQYILPSTTAIIIALYENIKLFITNAIHTTTAIIIGFTTSIIIAFIITIISQYSKYVNEIVNPLLVIIQITPKIALAPLFLIWFGYGILPKIILSSMICFFPIALELKKGIDSVPTDLLDIMNSIGATKKEILLRIQIPYAMPYLFSGLKIGIALATVGAIVGEFVNSSKGLGYQIAYFATLLDTPIVFAAISITITIGLTLYGIIAYIEQKLIYWNPQKEK